MWRPGLWRILACSGMNEYTLPRLARLLSIEHAEGPLNKAQLKTQFPCKVVERRGQTHEFNCVAARRFDASTYRTLAPSRARIARYEGCQHLQQRNIACVMNPCTSRLGTQASPHRVRAPMTTDIAFAAWVCVVGLSS